MIRSRFASLALAFVSIAVAPAANAAVAHRHVTDWSRTVAATPDGGMRIGNPQAKVKIVEFSSFTCPHCAAFASEGFDPLVQKYVRGGQVSFELRSALRDAIDLTVALAVRCVAPPRYFDAVEQVMKSQQDWLPRMIDYIGAHRDELNGAKKDAAVHAMLDDAGIGRMLAGEGVSAAAIEHCLSDKASEGALQKTSDDAWNVRKIAGTPAFLVDGAEQTDIHNWATLEPAIQSALKR